MNRDRQESRQVTSVLRQVKLSDLDKQDILTQLRTNMAAEPRSSVTPRRRKTRPWTRRAVISGGAVAACLAVVAAMSVRDMGHSTGPVTRFLTGQIGPAMAYTKVTPANFNQIQMLSPTAGWGSGYDRSGQFVLIKTTDGGTAWNQVTLPVTTPVYDVSTQQIGQSGYVETDFLNGSMGWLSWIDNAKHQMTVLETTDGGQDWSVSRTKVGMYASTVSQIDFVNAKQGWILASSTAGSGQTQKFLYRTTNGGQTWVKVADTSVSGQLPMQGAAPDLKFSSDGQHGWMASGNMASATPNVLQTADGGRHWSRLALSVPTPFTTNADAVQATAPQMVGQQGTLTVTFMKLENGADHDHTVVYHTSDGGNTWSPSVNSLLTDIAPDALSMGATNGWLVKGNHLYRSADHGQTWNLVSTLAGPALSKYPMVRALSFVNNQTGWLLLQSSDYLRYHLVKTDDGGRTWQPQ